MPREIPYIAAVEEAIFLEMARDETVVFYGQDVAPSDDHKFVQAYGRDRVRVSPISETAEIGMAVGLALGGYRPVVELLMAEFMLVAMNQVVNEAPRLRYMSGGRVKVPVVFKAGYGFAAGWAGQHTGSIYNMFVGIPGLKVALPATPADAKGLMASAIRDENPVCYLMHYLLVLEHGDVPEGEYVVPFGEAAVRREGRRRDDRRHGLDGRPGARRRGGARGRGCPGGGDRSAHAQPAGHGDDPRLGGEDRTRRSGRSGDAARRLLERDRGRDRRARVLLAEGADQACHRARGHDRLQRADGAVRCSRTRRRSRTPCARCSVEAPVAA